MRMLALAWLTVGACHDAMAPQPSGIEITGYLDASRVTWTWDDGDARATGEPGAIPASGSVELTNLETGDHQRALGDDTGAFSVAVMAAAGDRLQLALVDGPTDAVTDHRATDMRPDFPAVVAAAAVVDPATDGRVVVEVQFETPQLDGRVWAVNADLDAAVDVLERADDGVLHVGRLRGLPDHHVLIYWVPDGAPESRPLRRVVTLP